MSLSARILHLELLIDVFAMKPIAFVTICLLGTVAGFAKELSSIVPRDDKYIYVAALEKETPDQPSDQWKPTLYKIDVEKASVIERLTLSEHGAPVYCLSKGNGQVRIFLHEGSASNGSVGVEPLTREIVVNKQRMAVVREKVTPGHDEYEFQKEDQSTHAEKPKKRELESERNAQVANLTKNGMVLGEFVKGKLFLVSWSDDFSEYFLKIVRADSLDEIQMIPIEKKRNELGGFGGPTNSAWWGEQKVVLLFIGNSHFGFYAPSYVVIIDIATKQVKYIPIGSNRAMGIAY